MGRGLRGVADELLNIRIRGLAAQADGTGNGVAFESLGLGKADGSLDTLNLCLDIELVVVESGVDEGVVEPRVAASVEFDGATCTRELADNFEVKKVSYARLG